MTAVMEAVPFHYESNYDGDTVTGQMRVQFEGRLMGVGTGLTGTVWLPVEARVLGVDTEEVRTKTPNAMMAKEFTAAWCKERQAGDGIVLWTAWKREKYGRLLAELAPALGGQTLAAALIEAGLGVPYSGGKRV